MNKEYEISGLCFAILIVFGIAIFLLPKELWMVIDGEFPPVTLIPFFKASIFGLFIGMLILIGFKLKGVNRDRSSEQDSTS